MEEKKRIALLDELRGLLVLLMIIYHTFFTGGELFGYRFMRSCYMFFTPVEWIFAGLFIVICGFCCHLSHNNLKRGLLLMLIAVGISLVLWLFMRENMIWFGILHLLASCILLFVVFKKAITKCPWWIGILFCLILGLFTWCFPYDMGSTVGLPGLFSIKLPSEIIYQKWLFPIGLGFLDSADYFPLIPWAFFFFGGVFLGNLLLKKEMPCWATKSHVPALSWIGRHALLIYIVHQPVIYGVFWCVSCLH